MRYNKLAKELEKSSKEDSFFSGTIFSFERYSQTLVPFETNDGCYICSKNRLFWIFPHIKVDSISIKLETNNEDMHPCLFINEFDKNTCKIEDFSNPIFTILYQSSQKYKNIHYFNEDFSLQSPEGKKLTDDMKKIIHTLTIDCFIDNEIVYSRQFRFTWPGKILNAKNNANNVKKIQSQKIKYIIII